MQLLLHYFFIDSKNSCDESGVEIFFLSREIIDKINKTEPINKYKNEYGVMSEMKSKDRPVMNKFLKSFLDKFVILFLYFNTNCFLFLALGLSLVMG